MNTPFVKPSTVKDVQGRLATMRPDLSKGIRRIAEFLQANPGAVAILSAAEVAKRCDVHASTLVRLAQNLGLSGFRELQLLLRSDLAANIDTASVSPIASNGRQETRDRLRLRLLAESGRSFNQGASEAADRYRMQHPDVEFHAELHVSHSVSAGEMAHRISNVAADSHGLVLVAREHPAINRAVKSVVDKGVPVVCLTSDLPTSGRTAYVGPDQYASGSTAGWFCGRLIPPDWSVVSFLCVLSRFAVSWTANRVSGRSCGPSFRCFRLTKRSARTKAWK